MAKKEKKIKGIGERMSHFVKRKRNGPAQ